MIERIKFLKIVSIFSATMKWEFFLQKFTFLENRHFLKIKMLTTPSSITFIRFVIWNNFKQDNLSYR